MRKNVNTIRLNFMTCYDTAGVIGKICMCPEFPVFIDKNRLSINA